ncbi:hypothetical protein CDIK_1943 [Cucumispora dikerogammari]|nr:hypothetical protein CDIK_1943 [Cucumispora dikerogammari]
MNIVNLIKSYFKTPEDYLQDRFINSIIYETNLYRKMLGLTPLYSDENLTKYAKLKCKEKSQMNIFDKVLENETFVQGEKIITFKEEGLIILQMNFFITNNSDHPETGVRVVQALQLSSENECNLVELRYCFFGVGAVVGPYLSQTKQNEELIDEKPKKQIMYVALCFSMTRDNQSIKLSEIQITNDIKKHLENYIRYFRYDLNKFVHENAYFHGCEIEDEITNSAWLETRACEQLKAALEIEEDFEEIQRKYKKTIAEENKHFINIESVIIRSSKYIPSCILVNKPYDGISYAIKQRLKNKELNRFGMKVMLFKNKTFLVSIVFAKYK